MANKNRKPEFPLTPELSDFTFELAKEIGIDPTKKNNILKSTEKEIDAYTKSESGDITKL